ncbi:hypothetical protein J8273_2826 [Carpediemonas membranifera]|uniref:Uncharacterized protein n=1 Tax=Carpediemonas membranifera TaxID=201153 RepID=A0A8J6B4P5_9EUKA|nr:hypothetical protein J8273_2826 [Carpediemonas membranifera]|eukprot:KAG9395628.1 hypothetical protein J8273_2826 [Carpediemonas membranifera]
MKPAFLICVIAVIGVITAKSSVVVEHPVGTPVVHGYHSDQLLVGYDNGLVASFNPHEGNLKWRLRLSEKSIDALDAIMPDRNYLATVGDQEYIISRFGHLLNVFPAGTTDRTGLKQTYRHLTTTPSHITTVEGGLALLRDSDDSKIFEIPTIAVSTDARVLSPDTHHAILWEPAQLCTITPSARCVGLSAPVDDVKIMGNFIVTVSFGTPATVVVYDFDLTQLDSKDVPHAHAVSFDVAHHTLALVSTQGGYGFTLTSAGTLTASAQHMPAFVLYDTDATTLTGYRSTNGSPREIFSRNVTDLAATKEASSCTIIPTKTHAATDPVSFVAVCHDDAVQATLLVFRADVPKGRLVARVALPGLTDSVESIAQLVISDPLAVSATHFKGFFMAVSYIDTSARTRGRPTTLVLALPANGDPVQIGEPMTRKYVLPGPLTAITAADHGAASAMAGHHVGKVGFIAGGQTGHVSFVSEDELLTDFGFNPPRGAKIGKNYKLGDKPLEATAFKFDPATFITEHKAYSRPQSLSIGRSDSIDHFVVGALGEASVALIDVGPTHHAMGVVSKEDSLVLGTVAMGAVLMLAGVFVWSRR